MDKIIIYDNQILIDFYKSNGLEFDEFRGYLGRDIKSFAIVEDEKIIGAITVSIYKNKTFIEALAVDEKYRNQGYGKILLKKIINEKEVPIYTISKTDEFYLKNNFVYDSADLIDEVCKTCKEYNISCFPRVMIYNI